VIGGLISSTLLTLLLLPAIYAWLGGAHEQRPWSPTREAGRLVAAARPRRGRPDALAKASPPRPDVGRGFWKRRLRRHRAAHLRHARRPAGAAGAAGRHREILATIEPPTRQPRSPSAPRPLRAAARPDRRPSLNRRGQPAASETRARAPRASRGWPRKADVMIARLVAFALHQRFVTLALPCSSRPAASSRSIAAIEAYPSGGVEVEYQLCRAAAEEVERYITRQLPERAERSEVL